MPSVGFSGGRGTADVGVGPLVVTGRRSTAVRWTQPYLTVGLVLLTKRQGVSMRAVPRAALFFLTPFSFGAWIFIALSVAGV